LLRKGKLDGKEGKLRRIRGRAERVEVEKRTRERNLVWAHAEKDCR